MDVCVRRDFSGTGLGRVYARLNIASSLRIPEQIDSSSAGLAAWYIRRRDPSISPHSRHRLPRRPQQQGDATLDRSGRRTCLSRLRGECLYSVRVRLRRRIESRLSHKNRNLPLAFPYAPSPLPCATDAHTARSFAQARKSWISSARVVESGTVPDNASSSPCVDTSCFCANAAYIAVCTADSISAPENPRAATDTRSRSNSAGLRFLFSS